MSTANQRKRDRRKNLCSTDWQAEQEGKAIDRRWELGVVHCPRIKHTYTVDGVRYVTGFKHRPGGGFDRVAGKAVKVRHKHKTKHRDLRSENVHKRVENPELYKTLDARRKIHLMEYRAGLVKPGD